MFESLPSKIENKNGPWPKKETKKIPSYDDWRNNARGLGPEDSDLGFLILISAFKDDLPWLYEIGIETYRGLKATKSIIEKKRLIASFEKNFSCAQSPMFFELSGSEEMFMMFKEISRYLPRFLNRYLKSDKTKE